MKREDETNVIERRVYGWCVFFVLPTYIFIGKMKEESSAKCSEKEE